MGRTSTRRTDAAALPTTLPTLAGAVAAARADSRRAGEVPTQRTRRPVDAPAPLGSLPQAPVAEAQACTGCAGTSVTRLQMTLPNGGAATFVSCHDCETKGWFAADGAALALSAVLGGGARG